MSLTLLAPLALFASALLIIPVVIHLFKPRRVRQTPFSSLRWLHLTPQKLSRRVQWHQVLLFLLRAAFLSLLVLALAKPLLSRGGSKPRERFIVLDVSHSMNYQLAGQARIEQARKIAVDLVRRNGPGGRTAVLLTDARTRLVTLLSREPENFLAALEQVQAGQGETDLGSALPVIRGLLGRPRPDTEAEVWFVTDNRADSWKESAIATFLDELPLPTKVHVVDVGITRPQNAWIRRARLLSLDRPARRVLRVEMGGVGDANQERTLHVGAAEGMPARSRGVVVANDQATIEDFQVPPSANLDKGLLSFRLEPSDGLPGDDEFLLNLDTQGSVRVLLLEGPASVADPVTAGLPLRTALESLADAVGQPLNLKVLTAAEARPEHCRGHDVIFLADVPELSDDTLAAVEENVKSGTGAALVLGGAGKPTFLNERLFKPLDPPGGLLPSPVQPTNARGRRVNLTGVQWSHPLLAELRDLGLVSFERWFDFTRDVADNVLARIDDQAPAAVERRFGAGRVVVLNTGAADRWSDLTKNKMFVPLVDRLLAHLGPGGLRRNVIVGEVVTLPLSGWKSGETVTIVTPSERRSVGAVRPGVAERATLSFEADEAGVYRIERSGSSSVVVVQPGRGDSTLAPMEYETLRGWWKPVDGQVIRASDLDAYMKETAGRAGLWPWLLLSAGVVLLVETFFVHRLCPRASPKLVSSIVAPRSALQSSARNG